MVKNCRILVLIFILFAASGCATKENPDPLESYNRVMFGFNEYAYEYAIGPVTEIYTFVLPEDFQHGVTNFFNNTFEISHFVNDLLQLEFADAGISISRFAINTTMGILGFFDVAEKFGLPGHVQNFGLTFAYWGWDESAYLVLPLAGPTTVRDTVALLPDYYLNPLNYAYTSILLPGYNGGFLSDGVAWGIFGVYAVNQASIYLPQMDNLTEYAIDPYIAVRNAFLQFKRAQIKGDKKGDFAEQVD